MQKAVDFIEKNVQWIAIALGALWLLWVLWAYIVTPPVTVNVGGETKRPGEVDRFVRERAAEPLNMKMRQSARAPEMQVPSAKDVIVRGLNPEPVGRLATAQLWLGPTQEPIAPGTERPDTTLVAAAGRQAEAPVPPAPAIGETRFGRSAIAVVEQNAPQQPPRPLPRQPVNPNDPNAAPEIPTEDKDWVSVLYTVAMGDVGKAFTDAQIPRVAQVDLFRTCFLQVELQRQELQDSGQWGPEVTIRPLPLPDAPPYPAPGDRQGEAIYLQWAHGNPAAILQPRFHEVVRGDLWLPPGLDLQQQQQQQPGMLQPLDPNREYTREELMARTPEERMRYVAEQRKIRQQQQPQQRQQRPPRGRPGADDPTMMMEGMYNVRDDERTYFQVRQPARRTTNQRGRGGYAPYMGTMDPTMMDEMMMMDPAMMGMEGMDMGWGGMQQMPAAGWDPQNYPLPPGGEWDPYMVPDITGWAHDDTVEPGKVYRYRVRYSLKNPLYQNPNVAKLPADANKFAVVSAYSDWTSNVEVPERTRFFIAGGNPRGTPQVRVEVFSFKDGRLHSQPFTVSPGDMIGRTVNGIDYSTKYTVVDIPQDARTNEPFVLLVDPQGRMQRRDSRTDLSDPEYRRMREQAAADREADAVAGANPPPGARLR